MQRPQFANKEIYHIYNRGVEKRKTFMEDPDRYRLIHDLFEFNDKAPALCYQYKSPLIKFYQSSEIGSQMIDKMIRQIKKEPRKLLVEVLAWCLMPNHYHLLLRQLVDKGISLFMQKLGIGYTKYFNEKYKRSGVLFQGKFKAVFVKSESHFMHLPFYIHCNPLDLIEPGWREGSIKNYQKAIKFLESYRYSSHLDYIGKKNFPSVSQREFLFDIFDGPENYKKQYRDWLREMNREKLEKFENVILE